MELQGDLRDQGLSETLERIASDKSTGVLTLTSDDTEVTVAFAKGRVVGADSSAPRLNDRLCDLLVATGKLSPEILQRARDLERQEKTDLKTVLVDRAMVRRADLTRTARVEVADIISRCFGWSNGAYKFETLEQPEEMLLAKSPLAVKDLLLQGKQALQDLPAIRTKVRSLHMIFSKAQGPDGKEVKLQAPKAARDGKPETAGARSGKKKQKKTGPAEPEITKAHRTIFGKIDGRTSVREIVDVTLLGEFTVCSLLVDLLELGVITRLLRGSLNDVDCLQLVHAIGEAGATGKLIIDSEPHEMTLGFAGGRLTSAWSNEPEEGLLDFCYREGAIGLTQLQKLSELTTPDAHANVLEQEHVFEADRLRALERRYSLGLVASLCQWKRGSFRFHGERDSTAAAPEPLWSSVPLVVQAAKSTRAWSRIREGVGGEESVYELSPTVYESLQQLELEPEEAQIVSLLQRPHSVVELCEASGLSDFSLCQLLWAFRALRAVRHDGRETNEQQLKLRAALGALGDERATVDDLVIGDAAALGRDEPSGEVFNGQTLPDMLRKLYMAGSTGVMYAAAGNVKNLVYFSQGAVVAAASSEHELRLHSILLRLGLVQQSSLEKAIGECGTTPLGQYLMDSGALDEQQLSRAARTLVDGVLKPMFNWPEGRHRFESCQLEITKFPAPVLSTACVVLDGVRSMSDLTGIPEFLSHVRGFLGPHREPRLRFQMVKLSPAEVFLLSRMDGQTSVADLRRLSPVGDEETVRAIYAVLAAGLVELGDKTETPVQTQLVPGTLTCLSADEIAKATADMEQRDPHRLLEVAAEATPEQVQAAYERQARQFHPDRGGTPADKQALEALFGRVVDAYRILSDPEQRRQQDDQESPDTADEDSIELSLDEPEAANLDEEATDDPDAFELAVEEESEEVEVAEPAAEVKAAVEHSAGSSTDQAQGEPDATDPYEELTLEEPDDTAPDLEQVKETADAAEPSNEPNLEEPGDTVPCVELTLEEPDAADPAPAQAAETADASEPSNEPKLEEPDATDPYGELTLQEPDAVDQFAKTPPVMPRITDPPAVPAPAATEKTVAEDAVTAKIAKTIAAPPPVATETQKKLARSVIEKMDATIETRAFTATLQALERNAAQEPAKASHHLKLGDAYATRAHWHRRAEACYEKARELLPWSVDPVLALARLYARTGRAQRARTLYQKALQLDPDNAEALSALEPGDKSDSS